MKTITFKYAVVVGAALSGFTWAQAQDSSVQDPLTQKKDDLTDLNVDQLLNVVVTTASKKKESLFGAASAISVVSADDIKKAGAINIPEALRLVPGVQVAQVSSQSYAVSIRGFNSEFADKLLVLVDGRSIYNSMFGGIWWQDQDINLEDVDRIEVIRGPGGTMWGANAVNGVINIITKKAKDTQGTLIQASSGSSLNYANGALRYGGATKDGYYRVTATGLKRGQTQGQSGADSSNEWDSGRLGVVYDIGGDLSQKITLSGDLYKSDQRIIGIQAASTPPYETTLNNLQASTGGNLLGKIEQTAKDGSSSTLQTFYSRWLRSGPIFGMAETTIDFDFQHSLAQKGAHCTMFGLGARYVNDSGSSAVGYMQPDQETSRVYSGFIQDQVQVSKIAKFTYGTKLEHNDITGWEIQPSARLSVQPNPAHDYWFSLSRAVKTPTFYQRAIDFFDGYWPTQSGNVEVQAHGVPNNRSGTLIAAEAGYRVKLDDKATVDVAAYHNSYDKCDSSVNGTPYLVYTPYPHYVVPTYLESIGRSTTYGFEVEAKYQATENWKLNAGYSFTESRVNADNLGYNSPKHQASLLSSLRLSKAFDFSQAVYFYGSNSTVGAAAYARLDLRLAYHPSDQFEITVGGRNLWNKQHLEIPITVSQASDFVKPEFYVSATWKF